MRQPENFRWVLEGKLAVAGRPDSVSPFVRTGNFVVIGDFTPHLQKMLKRNRIPFVSFPDLVQRMENPNAKVNIGPVLSAINQEIRDGRRVLVCCRFGYTLSPTIALMYLAEKAHVSLFDALKAVKPLNGLHELEIKRRYFSYGDTLHENRHLLIHSHTDIPDTPPVVYRPLVRKPPAWQKPTRKNSPKTPRRPRRR